MANDKRKLPMKKNLHPLGYYCPILNSCCYCISLKKATYVIACLGLFPTLISITLGTKLGQKVFEGHGVPPGEAEVISYMYACLGVVVFSCHVVLFVAAIIHVAKLFSIYLWIMIFYIIVNLVLAFVIGIEAILANQAVFGGTYLLIALFFSCLLIYFWIAIQSQQFIVNDESNIINIHITII